MDIFGTRKIHLNHNIRFWHNRTFYCNNILKDADSKHFTKQASTVLTVVSLDAAILQLQTLRHYYFIVPHQK